MFDMNQCKEGDKLVCRDGEIVEYSHSGSDICYPHIIKYWCGSVGCRTPNGFMFWGDTVNDCDIIGFYEEEPKMIERDKRELREKYEATKQQLEELGKQLGIEG